MPDALAALVRCAHAWHQVAPHREPHLQICATCQEALLTDLARLFLPSPGPHRGALEASQVLGCTFRAGPLETCALHPWLYGNDACTFLWNEDTMPEPTPEDAIKALLPDPAWFALWTTAQLESFLPRRGSDGLMPVLEVHCLQDDGTRTIHTVLLAVHDFNAWPTRQTFMRRVGAHWATEGWQVLALRCATEAWAKAFTPEEHAARGTRLVETYDEKQEIVLVQGATLDGRMAMARAEILRDKVGRIRAVRPWEVQHATGALGAPQMRSQLLEAAWEGYLRALAARRGDAGAP